MGLPPVAPRLAVLHEAAESVVLSLWAELSARLAPVLRGVVAQHAERAALEAAAAAAKADARRATAEEAAAAHAAQDWSLPNTGDRILATALRSQMVLDRRAQRAARPWCGGGAARSPLLHISPASQPPDGAATPAAQAWAPSDVFAAPAHDAGAPRDALLLRRPASVGAAAGTPTWQRWLDLSQQSTLPAAQAAAGSRGVPPRPTAQAAPPAACGALEAKSPWLNQYNAGASRLHSLGDPPSSGAAASPPRRSAPEHRRPARLPTLEGGQQRRSAGDAAGSGHVTLGGWR